MLLKEINVPTKKVEILGKKGIHSVEGLLYSMPKKYLYFDKIYHLELTQELEDKIATKTPVAVVGTLIKVENQYKNGRSLIKMRLQDSNKKILFINIIGEYQKLQLYESFLEENILVGGVLQYSEEYKSFSMLNPEVISDKISEYNRIIPVYHKYKGISEDYYNKMINEALSVKGDLDYIPKFIIDRYHLLSYKDTVKAIHNPKSEQDIIQAKKRMIFDEMLYFTCKLEEQANINNSHSSYIIKTVNHMEDMIKNLPFNLTNGQNHAIHEMILTAKKGQRISALVQGDVGSGKTIVAFSMMFAMAENGYQSVLMAPTTVLAKQHYLELKKMAEKYGYTTVFLSNELKSSEKRRVYDEIKTGKCNFVVGTHSCISKAVEYCNLGLTITDEEHKFGVLQRESLISKSEKGVHNIIMSGTPIPRTLADTFYGNNTSVFSMELPGNRKPIQTAVCSSNKLVFNWMLKEIKKGHQCYVVCPLIDKAEENSRTEGVTSIEETSKVYEQFFSQYGIKMGVVTGKTSKEDQTSIIRDFSENKIQILMATTVIEVGVNVPNATVMVITGAERFGLATLHQLRGRVGRGTNQSYCILQKSPNATCGSNLEILCRETDGLEIAKEDLKNRGTGNIIGIEQSGQNKYINILLQYPNMYEKVKQIAKELCKNHTGKDIIKIYEEYYPV